MADNNSAVHKKKLVISTTKLTDKPTTPWLICNFTSISEGKCIGTEGKGMLCHYFIYILLEYYWKL